jgi:hypothetical protein
MTGEAEIHEVGHQFSSKSKPLFDEYQSTPDNLPYESRLERVPNSEKYPLFGQFFDGPHRVRLVHEHSRDVPETELDLARNVKEVARKVGRFVPFPVSERPVKDDNVEIDPIVNPATEYSFDFLGHDTILGTVYRCMNT